MMKSTLTSAFLFLLFSAAAIVPAAAGDVGSSGMRVFIDPETGELAAPPAKERGVDSEAGAQARSRMHEDVRAVPSAQPGGGEMVDIRGRFDSQTVAAIGPDGELRMRCVTPSEAAAPEGK